MPTCPYCSGITFRKNNSQMLECSSCGAPAPEGAMEIVEVLPGTAVVVLKTPKHLTEQAHQRLKADLKRLFSSQRVIILEEGLDIQFVGGSNASN